MRKKGNDEIFPSILQGAKNKIGHIVNSNDNSVFWKVCNVF